MRLGQEECDDAYGMRHDTAVDMSRTLAWDGLSHPDGPDAPPDPHDEYRAALALRHTPGLGPRTWRKIAETFSSLTEAARKASAWASMGLARPAVCEAFLSKSWLKDADCEYRLVRERGLRFVTWSDPRFPRRLRLIPDAPLCLYYLGDPAFLNTPSLALVGSRQCSGYGLDMARAIGEQLSQAGITIVSGLALGIDRQAHLAGLSGLGSSVAVLGTGLDRIYPEANADIWTELAARGLIVTEFPPLTIPEPRNFPIRNRIISGLSLGVLVAEAAEKSGSLITARLALDQGRDVFALPGPVTQATYGGCHALIRQGAQLVTSAEEILSALEHELRAFLGEPSGRGGQAQAGTRAGIAPGKAGEVAILAGKHSGPVPSAGHAPALERADGEGQREALGPEERLIFEKLTVEGRVHIDTLARDTGLACGSVSGILLALEMKELVRQWPGMYYSKKAV